MADVQKDLVLSINEYAYVLDQTKGNVSCWVGPAKTSLSTSDSLVRFNSKTKSFEKCSYDEAISLFTTAPENWYVVLKNPADGDRHPTAGTANSLPEKVAIGRKVNIRGPVSFALYPGQMAKVVRGHALRSNQYLLARVYEADSANSNQGEVVDAEGNKIENTTTNYVNGQILVIKGTEISFYIPPTGIEVIPVNNDARNGFVRDAVTLERLEYCILKDEDGNKRYVHGPEVVFPEPTETFVTSPSGGYIFRAIELSKISGVYVKVIAEYADEDGTVHPVGEELFITGEDQMIYYPRPEHAVISYDNKIMHHAIAIPEGEGRYIMNRLTGEINTVKGPAMYLPDPRTEVVVKRKLTTKQCELWFPGNRDALLYNEALNEKAVEKSTKKGFTDFMCFASCDTASSTLANLETNASISRGTSYTKPRTITLDNKFEGVVSIDVWTGYAVNVISKNGERKVVCGPQTILLDYDQTLEVLEMSTGKPKTTDYPIRTVYLRHENNKVSDVINVETKDFVRAEVKVSYCVDFDKSYMDKWFNIENYVKYLCDRERALIKREAKKYTIEEFYQNYSDIVHNIAINKPLVGDGKDCEKSPHDGHRFFKENGMFVHDCEVLSIRVESDVAALLEEQQFEMVEKALELANADRRIEVATALAEARQKEIELKHKGDLYELELKSKLEIEKFNDKAEMARLEEAEAQARAQAKQDVQEILDAIQAAELAREQSKIELKLAEERSKAELEAAKQQAYAETIKTIMESISEDLVAAITTGAESEMVSSVAKSLSPYVLAGRGESPVDVVNKLIRGTTLEETLKNVHGLTTGE